MAAEKKAFFKKGQKFEIIAHRGSSREFPENTLESFQRALEIYPHAVLEMDVWPSRDGHIIIMHDELLQGSTSGVGPVYSLSLKELKELEAGYAVTFDGGRTYPFRGKGIRIATLEEVLTSFPQARMSIDIKYNDRDFARSVVSFLEEHKAADRVILGSFHNRIVSLVRGLNKYIATSFSKKEILLFFLLSTLRLSSLFNPEGDAIMMPEYSDGDHPEKMDEIFFQGIRVLTPALVRQAHQKGLAVFIWTVDREDNMRRLIQWGVDGIVSNVPMKLKDIAESMSKGMRYSMNNN